MWPKYTIFWYKPIQGKPFSEHNNPIKTKKNQNHMILKGGITLYVVFPSIFMGQEYAVLEFNISDFFTTWALFTITSLAL